MTLEVIENQLKKFLESDTPQVISIRGNWGVGKTFLWRKMYDEAKKNKTSAFTTQSYVSLFGVNSIDDLKIEIFTRDSSLSEGHLKDIQKKIAPLIGGITKTISKVLGGVFSSIDVSNLIKTVGFQSLSKTIICFDDIERKGDGLKLKELMGLASILKENQSCKVVFIFNDEIFQKNFTDEFKDLEAYREKVIDYDVKFQLTAEEAVKIGFLDMETRDALKEHIFALNINNIRIIRRIEQYAKEVTAILKPLKLDKRVQSQALHSLTIFCWSFYCREENIPSFDWLKRYEISIFDKDKSEQHQQWQNTLNAYKFMSVDNFDLEIARFVEMGFLNQTEFKKQAAILNNKLKGANLEKAFDEVWNLYHNSFDDNEKEFVTKLVASFKTSAPYISPLNLNGSVKILRELGYDKEAHEIIQEYIKNRSNEDIFDLSEYPFAGEIDDKEVIEEFDKKIKETKPTPTLEKVIAEIISRKSRSQDDEIVLNASTEEDFYSLFKKTKGGNLSSVIKACMAVTSLQQDGYTRVDKARRALKRLASESKINAIRIKRKYDIEPDHPSLIDLSDPRPADIKRRD